MWTYNRAFPPFFINWTMTHQRCVYILIRVRPTLTKERKQKIIVTAGNKDSISVFNTIHCLFGASFARSGWVTLGNNFCHFWHRLTDQLFLSTLSPIKSLLISISRCATGVFNGRYRNYQKFQCLSFNEQSKTLSVPTVLVNINLQPGVLNVRFVFTYSPKFSYMSLLFYSFFSSVGDCFPDFIAGHKK